jgi:hypothetical protein
MSFKSYPNPKDPNDFAEYWYDFEPVLRSDETITAVSATVRPRKADGVDDITITGSPGIVGQKVHTRLSKTGTVGQQYVVEFEITTSDGQQFNRGAILKVADL